MVGRASGSTGLKVCPIPPREWSGSDASLYSGCDDRGAALVNPAVAVCMVPVPMRVDHIVDLARPYAAQRVLELLLRDGDAVIDHEQAVRTRQHADVATGAEERAHTSTNRLRGDRRFCRRSVDLVV